MIVLCLRVVLRVIALSALLLVIILILLNPVHAGTTQIFPVEIEFLLAVGERAADVGALAVLLVPLAEACFVVLGARWGRFHGISFGHGGLRLAALNLRLLHWTADQVGA